MIACGLVEAAIAAAVLMPPREDSPTTSMTTKRVLAVKIAGCQPLVFLPPMVGISGAADGFPVATTGPAPLAVPMTLDSEIAFALALEKVNVTRSRLVRLLAAQTRAGQIQLEMKRQQLQAARHTFAGPWARCSVLPLMATHYLIGTQLVVGCHYYLASGH